MTEEDDSTPRKLELSPVQVAASALAATSAAFFASWAGTAGTLIGAALGSVIATVGAATYTYSLKRTSELAKRTAAQVREGALLPNGLPRARASRVDETAVMPPVDDADVAAEAGEDVAWWRRFDPRGKQLPWGRVALASAAVMLVTLAVLTSFEGVTGRSVSDTVTGDDSSRTTVGNVFRGGGDTRDEEPAPQEDEQQQPDDGATPTPTDDATPTPTPEPTEDPTEEPSVEPAPTVEPTTPAPTPTAPAPDAAEPTEAPDASPSATPST